MDDEFVTRDGRKFPKFVIADRPIVTPYDLRAYANDHASDLTVGMRSFLRWLADRWEDAKWEDWDEVK